MSRVSARVPNPPKSGALDPQPARPEPVLPTRQPVPDLAYEPVLFFVDKLDNGDWVPIKQVPGKPRVLLMTPSPYRAVAWERLSTAVLDEYLASS